VYDRLNDSAACRRRGRARVFRPDPPETATTGRHVGVARRGDVRAAHGLPHTRRSREHEPRVARALVRRNVATASGCQTRSRKSDGTIHPRRRATSSPRHHSGGSSLRLKEVPSSTPVLRVKPDRPCEKVGLRWRTTSNETARAPGRPARVLSPDLFWDLLRCVTSSNCVGVCSRVVS
jgi:hypothetical protein